MKSPRLDADSGWFAGVEQLPSPNFNERPQGQQPEVLVIHSISLPPGEFGGPYITQLFQNCLNPREHAFFAEIAGMEVSAHLLIRRDGSVVQYVPLNKRAWHAGVSCFEGREGCNDFSIGIELEGCDEQPFEDAQYQALVQLTREIMRVYPQIQADKIVGHCDIAPERKTDPGPHFDWVYYRQLLAATA